MVSLAIGYGTGATCHPGEDVLAITLFPWPPPTPTRPGSGEGCSPRQDVTDRLADEVTAEGLA